MHISNNVSIQSGVPVSIQVVNEKKPKVCRDLYGTKPVKSVFEERTLFKDVEELTQFFTNLMPSQWFSCQGSKEGKDFSCTLPSEIATIERVIYIWFNTKEKKALIGKTETSVGQRLSRYGTDIRSDEPSSHKFISDIRANPEDFQFGILYQLKPCDNINGFESFFILFKQKILNLYNQNSGGGGGDAQSAEPQLAYIIPPNIPSPKRYPFRTENGIKKPVFTPTFYRQIEELTPVAGRAVRFVYSVKGPDGVEYIGISNDVNRRMGEHSLRAKRVLNGAKKVDGLFHKALAEKPTEFKAGVFRITHEFPPGLSEEDKENCIVVFNSADAEKEMIKLKKPRLNMTKGGEGPTARQTGVLTIRDLLLPKYEEIAEEEMVEDQPALTL